MFTKKRAEEIKLVFNNIGGFLCTKSGSEDCYIIRVHDYVNHSHMDFKDEISFLTTLYSVVDIRRKDLESSSYILGDEQDVHSRD